MFSQFGEHAIMEKHVHVIDFVSAYRGPLAVDKLWNADVDRLYPLSRLESFLVGEEDRLMQVIRSPASLLAMVTKLAVSETYGALVSERFS